MIKEPEGTLLLLKYAASRNLASKEGYQRYENIADVLKPHLGSKTYIKSILLEPHLEKIVNGKSVLDIGCDKAYFSWLAHQHGAISVTCNDLHPSLLKYLNIFCKCHGFQVEPRNLFVEKIDVQFDVTMALAMVHQVGLPVKDVIARIRSMTKVSSIIEFCEDYSEKYGESWNLNWFKKIVLEYYSSLEILCQYDAIGDYKGKRYICHARCSD